MACRIADDQPVAASLFEKMTPEACGIRFRNDVTDDSLFNEFTYRNFYNGGGVAIGDLNNDGLPEVVMTANQGKNRLFRNDGNFKFSDITDSCGISKKNRWNTGVTMADVNGDGLLDIYICSAGIAGHDKRENELYINQGKLRFKEEAEKYNLQDAGAFHTQASFFDYDLDGDLDAYLLNNSYLVPVAMIGNTVMRTMPSSRGGGHKLMRNDDGIFNDVTKKAGIFGSDIALGLGVSAGDINGDKWPDIYISNDFFEKDYLYINQRNGTFSEASDEYLSHMSQSSMGADIADINNDGWMDIFTTDMLPEDDYRLKKNTRFDNYDTYKERSKAGFHHQILGNMLHVNNNGSNFYETAQYSGVNATDWSWGALIFDMNGDGHKDIFVCNGMYLDATDQDYVDYTANEHHRNLFKQVSNPLDYQMLKKMMASQPLSNYAFYNDGNLRFSNHSKIWGLDQPGYSNGAAYADLDNDGDEDIVVNNINGESFVYRNRANEQFKRNYLSVAFEGQGLNRFGVGASVTVYSGKLVQTSQNFPTRGFQSSVEPILTFGLDTLDKIDSLLVVWPGLKTELIRNVPINRRIVLKEQHAINTFTTPDEVGGTLYADVTTTAISGNIVHRENEFSDFDRQRLMPRLLSTEGPKMAMGDVNGDGLTDFFVGASKHDTSKLFVQDINGGFRQVKQDAFTEDAHFEDAGSALFDADQDGDNDLVVSSAGNLEPEKSELLKVRLYRNNGKGIFKRDDKGLPDIRVNASAVRNCDFDGDGDEDIFIGGRCITGAYGMSPQSFLLINNNGIYSDATASVAEELQGLGMVTDAIWTDIDLDKLVDLVIVGEWMPVTIFKNTGGLLKRAFAEQFEHTKGWWNCIIAADMDNDGDLDLVGGNYGLNTKFAANNAAPMRLYVNDFDNNGTIEPIITIYKKDGKAYPYYLREDITAQIPSLKKKYLRYADYAGKTIHDVFSDELLAKSLVKEVNLLSSCLFVNEGGGKFTTLNLAMQAQLSPVFSIVANDFTSDGIMDLFLAGNFYGHKPELGRMDANMGTLLKGKSDRSFEFMPSSKSGLYYKGEGRDLLLITTNDRKNTLILSSNNDSLKMYKPVR